MCSGRARQIQNFLCSVPIFDLSVLDTTGSCVGWTVPCPAAPATSVRPGQQGLVCSVGQGWGRVARAWLYKLLACVEEASPQGAPRHSEFIPSTEAAGCLAQVSRSNRSEQPEEGSGALLSHRRSLGPSSCPWESAPACPGSWAE